MRFAEGRATKPRHGEVLFWFVKRVLCLSFPLCLPKVGRDFLFKLCRQKTPSTVAVFLLHHRVRRAPWSPRHLPGAFSRLRVGGSFKLGKVDAAMLGPAAFLFLFIPFQAVCSSQRTLVFYSKILFA
ncbi:hypothetical protein TGPRC2_426720 [Toxoplasma gondii TgCatPRC2]|uniref:Uncharacterized protein n=1 Tax=Toxoplasma gondii TgCatPRC2 TaxID=1130821 RepID=A0A151H2Q0_TOXGO|nr:hypothetical protein TGPRC2_426720 [Toxoplasma gondii TgCatPRC2]